MTNDTTVSHQWASRPADQRFLSIDELFQKVLTRRDNCETNAMRGTLKQWRRNDGLHIQLAEPVAKYRHWFQLRLIRTGLVHVKARTPTEALELARRYGGDLSEPLDFGQLYCFRVEAGGNWDMLRADEYPEECVMPWPSGRAEGSWNRGTSGY